MVHTITPKEQNKRILLIKVSNPVNPRTEPVQIMDELFSVIGHVTDTFYVIYDISQANITFSDIIAGITSFARPNSEIERQLNQYGRMILVGASTVINVAAKAAARFSPERQFPVFKTQEEALEYAQTELAKH